MRPCQDESLDPAELEAEVARLMADEDVTSKKGIYPYVLSPRRTEDERHLNIRAFTPAMRREAYERQGGKCAETGEACDIKENARRPHHPLVEGWSDQCRQLPDGQGDRELAEGPASSLILNLTDGRQSESAALCAV